MRRGDSDGRKILPLLQRFATYLERIRANDPSCVEVELACERSDGQAGLNDEHVRQLAAALRNNFHARSVNAWGNVDITDVGAEFLVDLLIDNRVIDRINLDITGVQDAMRARVQGLLFERCLETVSDQNPDQSSVHMLDLSRRNLSDSHVELVAGVLRDNPFITSLALWGNPDITDQGLQHILNELSKRESLVSVSLEGTAASFQMQKEISTRVNQSRRFKALSHALDPRMSVMNLASAGLTDAGINEIAQALRGNHALTTLLLKDNPDLSSSCIDTLLSALEQVPYLTNLSIDADSHRFSDLKRTQLRKWRIERIIDAIMMNAETFRKVDFSSCPLRDSEWDSVLKALRLNSTVVSLNLGTSKLSETSVQRLLDLIPSHPSLARIVMDQLESTDGNNFITIGGDISTDLRNLISKALRVRILERTKDSLLKGSVRRLDELQYIEVSDKDLTALIPALAQNTSLTELSLRCGANVSFGGMTRLLTGEGQRKCNTSLTRLHLTHTSKSGISLNERNKLKALMTTRCMSRVLKLIQNDLSHCNIDLSDQGIQDDDVLRMCSVIRDGMERQSTKRPQWSTLEINLSRNPVTNRGALALEELIESAANVLRLDLRESTATREVRKRIQDKLRQRAVGHASRLLTSSLHPPLVKRCASIDFLQGQALTDMDVELIAQCIPKGNMVEAIDLRNNHAITDEAGAQLLKAISSRRCSIHTLHLNGTAISSGLIQQIQKQLDRNALQMSLVEFEANSLQRKSVTYLRSRGLEDNDVAKLARALVSNVTISEIDFSCNPRITDASVRALEAALTNKEYQGQMQDFGFNGTRVSEKALVGLKSLLASRKSGDSVVVTSDQGSTATESDDMSRKKGDKTWMDISSGIEQVKHSVTDIVSALELERDGVSSSAILNMPFLEPLNIDPSRYKSMALDIDLSQDDSQAPKPKGIMQFDSIGVRLKFLRKVVNLTPDGLASVLSIPRHSVRVYPNRSDPHVMDIRLYDVSVNPTPSPAGVTEACSQVAARLFAYCQDASSSFCRQYNGGDEVFCHYPWALSEKDDMPVQANSTSLASCFSNVMKIGGTEWESKIQKVFSEACQEIGQALSDKVFKSANIKRVCEQFAAKALMQLEEAAQKALSLQRYVTPDEEYVKFHDQYQQCQNMCQEFTKFVQWIAGGGLTVPPLHDPEVEATLISQWNHVQSFFGKLRQDEHNVKGLKSAADPSFLSFLELQEKEAHETAKGLHLRCNESLVEVGSDLTDLAADKARRFCDLNVVLSQIREKRKIVAQQLEKTSTKCKHDLIEIQRYLKSYSDNSKRLLALSRQDDELARAERNAENDKVIADIDKQLKGLQATYDDWKEGKNVVSQLEVSIHMVSSEIRDLIKFEHQRLDHGVRDLALKVFKDNFHPIYMLSQLEVERLKYSIAIDRTEAERTKSWSNIYHPVGKIRKPQTAYHAWTNSVVQQHPLVAPSPFPPGSNEATQNAWGPSYERQRSTMPVMAQLVLDMQFDSIHDMEEFREDLNLDVASALECKRECVEVHSVVPGSVIVTMGLLADNGPQHGDRSPLDLMSELVRQSVDISSPLRTGKYTRRMRELKHVPASIADQSLHDQELRVASISDLCDRVVQHSPPVWDLMKTAKSAVNICTGSDQELLVFRNENADGHVCIPSYQLIKPVISYEEFIDQSMTDWSSDFLIKYFKSIESHVRASCAASKQFSAEYKSITLSHKRAQDNLFRLCHLEAKAAANYHKAERECDRASERVTNATEHLDLLKKDLERAEYLLKIASDSVIQEEKVLDQRRTEWHQSEEELFDVKCLECSVMTQMTVPHAEARILKAKRLFLEATAGLYFARWRQKAQQCILERITSNVAPAAQSVGNYERKHAVVQNEMEIAKTELMNIKSNLEKEKASVANLKRVLQAYRYVSESAPPEEEVDEGWLIPRSRMIFCTKLRLTVGVPYGKIAAAKAKFMAVVEEGLVNLLVGSNMDKDLRRDIEKCLQMLDVAPAMTGDTVVSFALLRDPGFTNQVNELLSTLQRELMPTEVGNSPVELHTGIGSKGSSTVHKLEILDPLGHGQFGEVREAYYEGAHVVAKTINLKGANAHEARVRAGRLAGELASQVAVLCLASHPNIVRVHGVYCEETSDGPPICGIVQEYAKDNLFDFIARHNAPHHETVELSLLQLNKIFELLDPHHTGRVTHASFNAALRKYQWIAEDLKVHGQAYIPASLGKPSTLQYVWSYGTNEGSILDPPSEFHHDFGRLDRRGVGSFTLEEFVLYYGPRELPEGKLAWPHRVAAVVAVANGMHFLLEHGLVHGNLKSSNIALVEKKAGEVASGTWLLSRIAVMDYGIPYLRRGFTLMPPFEMTTPAWIAPERLLDPSCVTPQGDIWSFGVIMWEILTGEVPWPGKTVQDLCERAKAGTLRLPVLPSHHKSAPAGYISIMSKCLDPLPERRPSLHDVCVMLQESKSQWAAEFLPG
jgi:serine/threonine protein kinase